MTSMGLTTFDRTVEKTNSFINGFCAEIGIEDKHLAFQGLRATLHALRDRIPVEEAVHLGSQFPVLLAGFYYQSWKPGATPTKERSLEAFLEKVRGNIPNKDYPMDTEQLVRAVFKYLSERVSKGEIEDIAKMMPDELKSLWPETVRP